MLINKLAIVLVFVSFGLSACSSYSNTNRAQQSREHLKTSSMSNTQSSIKSSVMLSDVWSGNLGIYSVLPYWLSTPVGTSVQSDQNYSLIHFFDYKTLNSIILCNKPNCKHNDSSCDAYFSTETKSEGSIVLFGISDTIYALTGDGVLYSMHEDGTDRQKVLTVPSNYVSGYQDCNGQAFL